MFQVTAHARLSSWEESIQQARTACEAWKKETALATKKMEQAIKEKENATAKASQLQKELDGLNGGPHLHAIARVSDLKGQPTAILKTIEWQLRKDLQEVEKVIEDLGYISSSWSNSIKFRHLVLSYRIRLIHARMRKLIIKCKEILLYNTLPTIHNFSQ